MHRNSPRPSSRAHALRLDPASIAEPAIAFMLAMLISWTIAAI